MKICIDIDRDYFAVDIWQNGEIRHEIIRWDNELRDTAQLRSFLTETARSGEIAELTYVVPFGVSPSQLELLRDIYPAEAVRCVRGTDAMAQGIFDRDGDVPCCACVYITGTTLDLAFYVPEKGGLRRITQAVMKVSDEKKVLSPNALDSLALMERIPRDGLRDLQETLGGMGYEFPELVDRAFVAGNERVCQAWASQAEAYDFFKVMVKQDSIAIGVFDYSGIAVKKQLAYNISLLTREKKCVIVPRGTELPCHRKADVRYIAWAQKSTVFLLSYNGQAPVGACVPWRFKTDATIYCSIDNDEKVTAWMVEDGQSYVLMPNLFETLDETTEGIPEYADAIPGEMDA